MRIDRIVKPRFFRTQNAFYQWLARHHRRVDELWVGLHRVGSGRPSITWPESVDAALCFGWIDGVRRTLDAIRYTIRFTPRRARSVWSAVNIRRARELIRRGRMRPAGLEAFEQRARTRGHSGARRAALKLDARYEKLLESNRTAWAFFQARPPWYRRTATRWIMSAKKEETRARRLAILIRDSARGQTIPPLTRPGDRG